MTKIKKLAGGRMEFHDHYMRRMAAKVPAGTKLKDILHPQYFQNYIDQFSWGTAISVISEDLELDCELRVTGHTKTTASVRIMVIYADPDNARANPAADIEFDLKRDLPKKEPYTVEWGGRDEKYRIMHSKQIIEQGFLTKPEATKRAKELADN